VDDAIQLKLIYDFILQYNFTPANCYLYGTKHFRSLPIVKDQQNDMLVFKVR